MRPIRILSAIALLLPLAGQVHAQGCGRMSWNTCDPWVRNKNFTGPGLYSVVVSAYGLSAPTVGTDSQIGVFFIENAVPDAWRFDPAGCQLPSELIATIGDPNSACPTLGSNPQSTFQFILDQPMGMVHLHFSTSYDSFTPSPATRYAIWRVTFDRTYSNAGPTPPDNSTCGGAELPAGLSFDFFNVEDASGQVVSLPACDVHQYPWCAHLTWNANGSGDFLPFTDAYRACDALAVPAQPTTWGRVKSLYR